MSIEKIKKRDGRIVDFDRSKIESAVSKAFLAVTGDENKEAALVVTDSVVLELENLFSYETPEVERVQDLVEKKLVENGYFDIAKSYIIYRQERADLRKHKQEELLEKIERSELQVKKRNGSLTKFDIKEIEGLLRSLFKGEEVDVAEVVNECKRSIYDGISTQEINTALLMSFRGRIERDPVFSSLASKLLANELYKEVLGIYEFESGFAEKYREGLKNSIKKGVEIGRIDPKMLEYDFKKLSAALDLGRDNLFRYLGMQTLYDRYFLRDYEQNILETPQYFWMRVAMGLSINEKDKNASAVEFYNVLSNLLYVTSTPTLFHSGTTHPQMSSCYITTVEDDLKHIFKCIADDAELAKWSGGIGNDWTNIRGRFYF